MNDEREVNKKKKMHSHDITHASSRYLLSFVCLLDDSKYQKIVD